MGVDEEVEVEVEYLMTAQIQSLGSHKVLDRIMMTLEDDNVPMRWIIVANLPFSKRCVFFL